MIFNLSDNFLEKKELEGVVDNPLPQFPNFLIPGAGKSGTSVICNFLNQHPDVFVCDPKEPCFFAFEGAPPSYTNEQIFNRSVIHDLQKYLALFPETGKYRAVGDASTYYLLLEERSIANIKLHIESYRDIRIILILRNPVDRAFSNYSMFRMNNVETLEFEDAISPEVIERRKLQGYGPSFDYLEEGLYYRRVKAYVDAFPHIRVYLYEDLMADAKGLMADIYSFLGVDAGFVPDINRRINVSGSPRSKFVKNVLTTDNSIRRILRKTVIPLLNENFSFRLRGWIDTINHKRIPMQKETRQRLVEYYRADVRRLSELIGRDLAHWR